MVTNNYLLIIVTVLMSSCPLVAAEAVYKWVDENGVTQLSEKKPVGYEFKNIEVAPPPPDEVVKEAQTHRRTKINRIKPRRRGKRAATKERRGA